MEILVEEFKINLMEDGKSSINKKVNSIGAFNNFLIEKGYMNTDKLARFSSIAPANFNSAGKGKNKKSKKVNRELYAIFFFSSSTADSSSKGKQPSKKSGIFRILSKEDIRRKNKNTSFGLCNEKACKHNLWNDEE